MQAWERNRRAETSKRKSKGIAGVGSAAIFLIGKVGMTVGKKTFPGGKAFQKMVAGGGIEPPTLRL
jgi:hypothetical protein